MSEHIGGKGSGASSSSEFLRAYRAGVLAGANASYQTIPKKAAKSYTTAADLLEARNQRGVLADLSSVIVTKSTCPVVYTGPHRPLEYVSTNRYSSLPSGSTCIVYVNTGDLYVGNFTANLRGIYAINPFRPIVTGFPGIPISMMQSHIDGKVYTMTSTGDFISYTIGGIGYTTLFSSTITGALGITQDNLGNFYFTNTIAGPVGEIYKISPPYSSASKIGIVSGEAPSGITYASDGNLYVITLTTRKVYRFSTAGVGQLLCNTGIQNQYGIIQANDGNLYIGGVFQIGRVTLAGVSTTFANVNFHIYGMTQGADENFYVSSIGYGPPTYEYDPSVYQIVVR